MKNGTQANWKDFKFSLFGREIDNVSEVSYSETDNPTDPSLITVSSAELRWVSESLPVETVALDGLELTLEEALERLADAEGAVLAELRIPLEVWYNHSGSGHPILDFSKEELRNFDNEGYIGTKRGVKCYAIY